MRRNIIIAGILLGVTINLYAAAAQEPAEWQATARVKDEKTHVVPAFWAELPKLNSKTRLKILDVDGPGVVTMIHLSAIGTNFGVGFDSAATQSLILRVFYDGEATPAIEMPLMDFLADVQAQSEYFSTVYFSKVKNSHNFRLPMPFRKHIVIEVENPSDQNVVGSADVQWEEVAQIPADCGYLRTAYQTGELQVKEANNVLFKLDKPATIAAHWLQFETPSYPNGGSICEANQELYLDGDEQPTLNYLGTEDVYGYSWGFMGAQSATRSNLKPTAAWATTRKPRQSTQASCSEPTAFQRPGSGRKQRATL